MPKYRDGVTVSVDTLEVRSGTLSTVGIGSTDATGVTVVEKGNDVFHKTILTLTDAEIALTDEAGVVAYGGLKVYDFPEGLISLTGASADLVITKSSAGVNDDWDGDFALGLVTASNNATLSSTEGAIIPSTATPQASSGSTTAKGNSTQTETGNVADGTTTPQDVYLNFLVDDADHDVGATACNLIANGTITIVWASLGDY